MDEKSRIDDFVAPAWQNFADELVETLQTLGSGSHFAFHLPGPAEPSERYLQFSKTGTGAEILIELSSNQVLTGADRLTSEQVASALSLGWAPPAAPNEAQPISNFHVFSRAGHVDAAALVVATLRHTFHIFHPDFLGPAPQEDALHFGQGENSDPHAGEEPLPTDVAYYPKDFDDLKWALSQSLRNHFQKHRPPNGSGAYTVQIGCNGASIRPWEAGVIEVVGFAAVDVRSPDRSREILSRFNADVLISRFHLEGDAIVTHVDVPALPFVPRHLYTVLNAVSAALDNIGSDFAAVASGATIYGESFVTDVESRLADETADDELPEELMTLIHLQNEKGVDVTADIVAALFHYDRSFLLQCIQTCEEQVAAWNDPDFSNQDQQEPEWLAASRHEAQAWEDTISELRRGLHHLTTTKLDPEE